MVTLLPPELLAVVRAEAGRSLAMCPRFWQHFCLYTGSS